MCDRGHAGGIILSGSRRGTTAPFRPQRSRSQLTEAGQAWADEAGLPCALETLTLENVAFYERRGYAVVETVPLPGTRLVVASMRRASAAPDVPPDHSPA